MRGSLTTTSTRPIELIILMQRFQREYMYALRRTIRKNYRNAANQVVIFNKKQRSVLKTLGHLTNLARCVNILIVLMVIQII